MSLKEKISVEKKAESSLQEHRYDFVEGDRVVYHPVGGSVQTSTGVIKRILVHAQRAGESGVTAKASAEHPRFVIENDHTHKETAYK